MLRGEFQIAPLNLPVVFVDILDAEVRNRNPPRDNLEVVPLGNFSTQRLVVAALVRGHTSKAGIKLPLHFVVELDPQDFAAAALDFIAS